MQKLTVIFKAQEVRSGIALHGKGAIRMHQADGVNALEIFQMVVSKMRELQIPDSFSSGAGTTDSSRIAKNISESGKWGHILRTETLSFSFSHVSAMHHSRLEIKELVKGAAKSWDQWVQPFLDLREFTQAWIVDVDYDFWQNAQDPLQYRSAGKEYLNLPMVSNDLPPPLEQKIIDISRNPGRWYLRSGYVEAVGNIMWFGENFWSLLGPARETALSRIKGVKVANPRKNITRAEAAENFSSNEKSGKMQEILRKTLYF